MIIVGERINTSNKRIARAVEERDAAFIAKVARKQARAAADYIDVNAGTFLEREADCLCWMVETVQAEVDVPLCLDSTSPDALACAVECHRGEPMINSISLEEDRLRGLIPVIKSRPCKVVALCMFRDSMPTSAEERMAAGVELVGRLEEAGVERGRIYLDPLVQPVSVDFRSVDHVLGALGGLRERVMGIGTICGLSNVSFGLPRRRLINRCFLSLCMAQGLSAAILDPTDGQLMATLLASEALLGSDEYCQAFIEAHLAGRLKPEV
jgi:5-methyltetrahydrofolate--homocysteine methyltransferase